MGNHEPIGDKELAAQSEWIQHMRAGIRHCPYGHPLDRKNLIHRRKTDGSLQRRRRECERCRALAAYHRKHPGVAYRSDEERRRVDPMGADPRAAPPPLTPPIGLCADGSANARRPMCHPDDDNR